MLAPTSLFNMDENFVDMMGENEALPDDVKEKLSNIFEKYQQLTDEEKEEFKQGAFDVFKKSIQNKLSGNSILPTWLAPYQSYLLFMFAVSIVAFLLGTAFCIVLLALTNNNHTSQ